MFTLAGFSESVAATTASEKLTAIVDEHIKTEGDAIYVPSLNNIIGIYPVGTDIQNVQLASPELRKFALYDVAPVENAIPPAFPPDPLIKGENYVTLIEDEGLTAYAGNSNAGAQQESVLVFFGDADISPVSGRIHTIKVTTGNSVAAYAWNSAVLTLSQELPVGNYQVVGARLEHATALAFRFLFIGGTWRPGMPCVSTINAKDPTGARNGQLGVWGTFAHNKIPLVEMFGATAATAGTLYIDLVKV